VFVDFSLVSHLRIRLEPTSLDSPFMESLVVVFAIPLLLMNGPSKLECYITLGSKDLPETNTPACLAN